MRADGSLSPRGSCVSDDDKRDPKDIGNLLWRLLMVDRKQLRAAVDEQARNPDARLGELLVRSGALSAEDLATALDLQTGLRSSRPADVTRAAERLLELTFERDGSSKRTSQA